MTERMIALVAKKPLTYAGRDFQAGDVFIAESTYAAMLTYRRQAWFAPKDAPLTPEPEPETPRRRRYRTRQLKAEE